MCSVNIHPWQGIVKKEGNMLRKSQSGRDIKDTTKHEGNEGRNLSTAHNLGTMEKTVIGEHITIQGDIKGSEDLVIQGSVKGSIALEGNHLTVGAKGQVEAEIDANNVTISGHLIGNIKAKGTVEITKEADFTGEIKARRISVQDGAYLKAVIELERGSEHKGATVKSLGSAASRNEEKIALAQTNDQIAFGGDPQKVS
jgi:cytoskeletal protein CcmA (bactofilin family)